MDLVEAPIGRDLSNVAAQSGKRCAAVGATEQQKQWLVFSFGGLVSHALHRAHRNLVDLQDYSAIGATIEGNRSLRGKAAESAVVFLRKVFTR
jgi:hypothetical protein